MKSLVTRSWFAALLITMTVVFLAGAASAAVPAGTFTRVEGIVDVLRGGSLPALAVKAGDDVFQSDIIRTKTNSRAEILFTDKNVLKIGQRSRIDISEYPREQSGSRVVKLQRGIVGAEVSRENTDRISTSQGGYKFEIHTTTAVAGVRGTIFYSFVGPDGVNHFSCMEGTIYVSSMGVRVEVPAGYTVDIRPGVPPGQPRPMTETEKKQMETAVITSRQQSSQTGSQSSLNPEFITETPGTQTDVVMPPPLTETQTEVIGTITGTGGGGTSGTTAPVTYTTAGQAGIYSLYIDSLGNAGIMIDGKPVQIEPASVVSAAGISPSNFSSGITSFSVPTLSGSGGFTGVPPGGSILITSGSATGFSPGDAMWGTYSAAFSGDYAGTPANTWNLQTYPVNPQTSPIIVRTENFGASWANNTTYGKTLGYFVSFTPGASTGILAGDFNGTYSPLSASNGLWQGASTGVMMDTQKVLALLNAGYQSTLAQLGLPCVEVGRTNFSGTAMNSTIGTLNFTISDAIFLTVQGGAPKPGLWISGNVSGSYTGSLVSGTGSISSPHGLSGGVSVMKWDPLAGQFLLSLNGSGIYSGTGTLNGTNVMYDGHAAGWFSGPGTVAGTASGFFK